MNDLADAMRWISGNVGTIGFDCAPDVYLMGHSSGAHISLLYLIRQAEQQEAEAAAAAVAGQHNLSTLPAGSPKVDSRGADSTSGGGDVLGGDASDINGDGGGGRLLEVEGFIGLAGVYDIYRHYLYESWRYVSKRRL